MQIVPTFRNYTELKFTIYSTMVVDLFNHEEKKANDSAVVLHSATALNTPTMLRCTRVEVRSLESQQSAGNNIHFQLSLAIVFVLGIGLVILLFRLSKKLNWRTETAHMRQDLSTETTKEVEAIENGDENLALEFELHQVDIQQVPVLAQQREQHSEQQSPMVVATQVPTNVKTIIHFDITYDTSEVPTGLDAVEIGIEAVEGEIMQIV